MGNKYILQRLTAVSAILATLMAGLVVGATTASADNGAMSSTPTVMQGGASRQSPLTTQKPGADSSSTLAQSSNSRAQLARSGDSWHLAPNHGPTSGNQQVTITPPPAPGITFEQVSAGLDYSSAIGSDGNLYSWGYDGEGATGTGTGLPDTWKLRKVDKPDGTSSTFRWKEVESDWEFTLAIGSDGNLYSWGSGPLARDNSIAPHDRPGLVQKPAGTSSGFSWVHVVADTFLVAALGSDGNLYTWGQDEEGLGRDYSVVPVSRPGKVEKPDGASYGFSWTDVGVTGFAMVALGSDGNLYSWGTAQDGVIGRDTGGYPSERPGLVNKPAGTDSGFYWTEVHAAGVTAAALGSDGELYTWGATSNYNSGQVVLGRDTSVIPAGKPGKVVKPADLAYGWKQINMNWGQVAALDYRGNLFTWGYETAYGVSLLGRSGVNDRPGRVLYPSSSWIQASWGGSYILAINSDGFIYSWGVNQHGELGRNNYVSSSTPDRIDPPKLGTSTPTEVRFDTRYGTYLTDKGNGTWTVITPSHAKGVVDVSISWTAGGVWQPVAHESYTYDPSTFTVRFDPAGGTPNFGSQTVIEGERVIKPPTDPTRYGYTFVGWYNGSLAYNFNQPVSGNLTLTAHWTRIMHTVRFNVDGGSPAPPAVQVGEGDLVTRPSPDPVKAGMHLDGWYTSVSSLNAYDFSQPVTADMTLTARWSRNKCTIRFDPAGGMNGPGDQQVFEGEKASRPNSDPTRAGYLFDGWFIGTTPVAYDFEQPVTESMTLTAHWTRESDWSINPTQGPAIGGTRVTLTPPAPRGVRFAQFSVGLTHSVALGSDGNLYSWGRNSNGQLGDGTTDNSSVPVKVKIPAGAPAGFTWTHVSVGSEHSLAFGSDGNLYAWGANSDGQLGNHSYVSSSSPVMVRSPVGAPAGFTWKQASAGYRFCVAIGSDGKLYAWGYNGNGQVGDGTTDTRPIPVLVRPPAGVPAGFTWKQAFARSGASLALGSDGNLYASGYNTNGGLGNGTTIDSTTLVKVKTPVGAPDGFTWKQAIGGTSTPMAFGSDGNLYAWGYNNRGQVGDGTSTLRSSPVRVKSPVGAPDVFTWKWAAAGDDTAFAFGSDGNLYGWGENYKGQVGDGTTVQRYIPVRVNIPAGASTGFTWRQVSASYYSSAALGSDGNLYAWGDNSAGNLGDGTNSAKLSPVKNVIGQVLVSDVRFDGMPSTSLPVRQSDGSWLATTPPHAKGPVDVAVKSSLNGLVSTAHLAYEYVRSPFTVKFETAGGVNGPGDQTVLEGDHATRPGTDPTRAGYLFDGWFISDVAYDFNRPVMENLTLTAHWTAESGWTIDPHRGLSTGGDQVTLTPPVPRGIRFTQTSSNLYHTLAIGSDGNMYAWGYNSSGQLGDGTTTNSNKPVRVRIPVGAPAGFTWKQASAGEYHSLGLGSDGNLYAWGYNYQGRLGDGTTYTRVLPVKIVSPAGAPVGFTWKQVSAGSGHSLGLGSDGNLYAWGYNAYGQLGNGSSGTDSSLPVKVNTPDGVPAGFAWTDAAAGVHHNVALGSDGNLYAWGDNGSGQLGDGTGVGKSEPVKIDPPASVRTGFTWKQIATRGHHSQALGSDGNLYAWGLNSSGQLGDGSNTTKLAPVKVLPPVGASAGFTWTQVSTGQYHSVALGSDGNLYAWGLNSSGRLGDGTTTDRSVPVGVRIPAGAPAGFAWTGAVAAGMNTLDLGSDGNLYSWGRNTYGELGDGTTTNRDRPTQVAFPDRGRPTGVDFGTAAGTGITAQPDGTWLVDTPAHPDGSVPVTIRWTRNGVAQADDTSNTYRFVTILPLAGGTGILALLLAGLLTMAGVTAARRHRLEVGPTGTGGDA